MVADSSRDREEDHEMAAALWGAFILQPHGQGVLLTLKTNAGSVRI